MATKGNKVYLLTIESSCDGAQNTEMRVFAKIGDAKGKLVQAYQADLNDWKCAYEKGMLVHHKERNNMSAEIYEKGNYNYNHIAYGIEELVIE